MSEAPKMIWLQYYGDSSPDEVFDEDSGYEVTWCEDSIFTHDVLYRRADIPWLPEDLVGRIRNTLEILAFGDVNHAGRLDDCDYPDELLKEVLNELEVKK